MKKLLSFLVISCYVSSTSLNIISCKENEDAKTVDSIVAKINNAPDVRFIGYNLSMVTTNSFLNLFTSTNDCDLYGQLGLTDSDISHLQIVSFKIESDAPASDITFKINFGSTSKTVKKQASWISKFATSN